MNSRSFWITWGCLTAALVAGLFVARYIHRDPPLPDPVTVAVSARHPSEVEVCREIAQRPNWRGNVEERLHDAGDGKHAANSRIDILTATHCWEADWAHKWTEAIGQSLYYSQQWNEEHTGDNRKPGVLLLLLDPDRESHFVTRCRRVCDEHGITLVTEVVR
jgi:hypothetical protein